VKVERRQLERNLPRKGFVRQADRHHIYFKHQVAGRFSSVYTKVSHSPKMRDIDTGILTAIRKQLRLDNTAQVVDLVNCPMDEHQYNEILRRKGIIP